MPDVYSVQTATPNLGRRKKANISEPLFNEPTSILVMLGGGLSYHFLNKWVGIFLFMGGFILYLRANMLI